MDVNKSGVFHTPKLSVEKKIKGHTIRIFTAEKNGKWYSGWKYFNNNVYSANLPAINGHDFNSEKEAILDIANKVVKWNGNSVFKRIAQDIISEQKQLNLFDK